jgi:hypothetical protein
VVLSAEDDAATTLVPRLVAAGADLGKVTIVNGLPGGEPFRIPDHLSLLRAKVIETGARLVVVDPLYGFLNSPALTEMQLRKALNPLAALAKATGAAVLVVRHLTKKSGKAMYQGGGSIAVVALARTAMRVDSDPEHPGRHVLAVVKCNLGPPAPSLRYRLVEKIVESDEDQGLTAPAVEWLGTTDLTADDLAAGPGGAVPAAPMQLVARRTSGAPEPRSTWTTPGPRHGAPVTGRRRPAPRRFRARKVTKVLVAWHHRAPMQLVAVDGSDSSRSLAAQAARVGDHVRR